MVSIKYPDNVQSKISLLEAANGAGLFIGPIFGGLVYKYTHFCVPFFLFSGIFLMLIPLLMKSLGPELDRDDNKENDAPKIGYLKLLSHKRVLFSGLNQFWNMIVFCSGQPIFGPRLKNTYGLNEFLVGVMFAVPCVAYIIGGPVLIPLMAKKFEPRTTKIFGFFILAV
jgi:fucose permease